MTTKPAMMIDGAWMLGDEDGNVDDVIVSVDDDDLVVVQRVDAPEQRVVFNRDEWEPLAKMVWAALNENERRRPKRVVEAAN